MKKLLALVLALVMSMSLVTISNAADFKDVDKIDNLEAVKVMKAVGVLDGYVDGSFGPTDTLTRAQACKIIAYLDLGGDAADALMGTGKVFTDVAANNWAAGFIEYCAQAGYVSGIGDGKFDPNAKVTGLQFAKMLLAVLGYDAEIEGLVGSAWEINTAKLAAGSKLFKNIDTKSTLPMTRQEAAQAAFNALNAVMYEYENMDREGYFGKATKKVDAKGNEVLLRTELYGNDLKVLDAGEDEFGRPTTEWKYKNGDPISVAKDAELTYSGKVTGGDIYSDLGMAKKDAKENFDVYSVANDTKVDIEKDSKDVAGAVGSLTEVFVDDDGELESIVNIPYYVVQINDVTEADEDDEDSKRTVAVKVGSDDYDYETESFEEDDYVVVALGEDDGSLKVMSMTLAESVSGKVSSIKSGKVTISGTAYSVSASDKINVKDEGTFYLNVDGSIGAFEAKSDSTGAYAYIYNTVAGEKDEDGKDGAFKFYYIAADGTKSTAAFDTDTDRTTLGIDVKAGFTGAFEYKMTDDGMKLVEALDKNASQKLSNAKIGADYANSKTVFVFAYQKDGTGKWTSKVVTGMKNVEELDAAAVVYTKASDGIVTYAFVIAEPADASTKDNYAILVDADASATEDGDDTVYVYDVMIDGKKTTLTFEVELDAKTFVEGVVFTYDTKGSFAEKAKIVTGDISGNVIKVVDGSIAAGDNVYDLADDAVVYIVKLVKGDVTVSTGSVKADDSFYAFWKDEKDHDKGLGIVVVDNRK